MNYTNSNLISYTKISPNRTSPRNHAIDTITIHCMAGNLSVETCGNVFAPASYQASSNYGIGSDGRIAMYVEEKDRSWCSSSSANDHRAVTIEVANDGGAPDWHVSDKALASLIELIADICRRNNIRELKWKADKSLVGQVDKQNMTVHKWFANTACPGNYLYGLHGKIAGEVNKKLGVSADAAGASPAGNPSGETDAKPTARPQTSGAAAGGKSNEDVAREVITGKWGNGSDRVNRLCAAGYDYGTVQGIVNKMLNGTYRGGSASNAGQTANNPTNAAGAAGNRKSNEQLAKEVIAGKWGNGSDRVNRLRAAGYNPAAVQKIVNRMLL